jgi:hypothetical protein
MFNLGDSCNEKSLLALAALTAFAGGASAQSSVTLFGVLDVNARHQDNTGSAGSVKSLSTDGNASSPPGPIRVCRGFGGGSVLAFLVKQGHQTRTRRHTNASSSIFVSRSA